MGNIVRGLGYAVALLALCAAARAGAQIMPELADTYVVQASPTQNYAGGATLVAGTGNMALLGFDLSLLPKGSTASAVSRALLTVYVDHAVAAGTLSVAAINSGWAAASVTWATKPPVGAVIGTASLPAKGGYVTLDVTAAVTAWLSGTANNGLAVSANSGTVTLEGLHNALLSHAPILQVIMTGAKGPAGPQGPAGPKGALGPQGPAGVIGQTGAIGPQGPAGGTGPAGPQGQTGPQGQIGPEGQTGAQGSAGAAGSQGLAGGIGPQGPTGPQGVDGIAGSQGPAGGTGPQGPTGATGPQGPAGVTGGQVWSATAEIPPNTSNGFYFAPSGFTPQSVTSNYNESFNTNMLIPQTCTGGQFTAALSAPIGTQPLVYLQNPVMVSVFVAGTTLSCTIPQGTYMFGAYGNTVASCQDTADTVQFQAGTFLLAGVNSQIVTTNGTSFLTVSTSFICK
jgi:hypothetical protein